MSSDLEIAAFIGLDWADQQHVIRLRVAGSAPVEAQLLDQKPETLRSLDRATAPAFWGSTSRHRFRAVARQPALCPDECRLSAVVSGQSPEPGPVSQSLLPQRRQG